ncbi:hypothetical protein BV898_18879 [Hypsibius exemplaris]|uniref:Uncharacterized protein n=1 Tax=Hypsibius exemplaris TaxID=2072580 RepID=A0A9X6NI35_HYPEX|nr:hypothetical protein BV898_18879 [Hypsibius exemplaris]
MPAVVRLLSGGATAPPCDWPAGLEKTSDDVRLIQAYENHTLEYRERLLRRHLGITEALLKDKDNEMFTASADDFPDFPPGRILEMQKMAKKVARYAEVVSDCAKV